MDQQDDEPDRTPPRPDRKALKQLVDDDDDEDDNESNNNNNNNNNQEDGDTVPLSPSASTTCSVSTATGANNAVVVANINNTNGVAVGPLLTTQEEERRRHITRQIQIFGALTGVSVSGMVLVLIPIPILIGFSIMIAFVVTLLYQIYQLMQMEMQSILNGNGFGRYILPDWLYRQLVDVSFHQWMIEGTFVEEYRFLALYFIPGTTTEQLNNYVDRLVPRHRNMVLRPGLGHLFGDNFMRYIVGDEGLTTATSPTSITSATAPVITATVPSGVPRRLQLPQIGDHAARQGGQVGGDDDTALGTSHSNDRLRSRSGIVRGGRREEDGATPLPRQSRINVATESSENDDDDDASNNDRGIVEFFTTTAGGHDDDEDDEDLSEEMNILVDALSASMANYYNEAYNVFVGYASNFARGSVRSITSSVYRTGISIGMASIGIGLFGIAMGYWEPPRHIVQRLPTTSTAAGGTQRTTFLLSSAMASGLTAGLLVWWPGSTTSGGGGGAGSSPTTSGGGGSTGTDTPNNIDMKGNTGKGSKKSKTSK